MPHINLPMWRLQAARALAWALLLGGWVGLGSLSQTLAPEPFSAFALIGVWLLALGGFSELIGKFRLQRTLLRGLLMCAALLACWALFVPLHGGDLVSLLPALVAWAIVVSLASSAVRACRVAAHGRLNPPNAAAAAGALLAWVCVGDLTDLASLGPRLMVGALLACGALAVLLPKQRGAISGCRAGLFDCSLPNWSPVHWRSPQRWPVLLASVAMLPMMCSLPLMVSLCRGDSVSAQTVLGVHFAAMFLPALLVTRTPNTTWAVPSICAALLAIGALVLLFASGTFAWWGLALAHGAAWSVAWAAQLNDRRARSDNTTPLLGAALNASFVLALGLTLNIIGVQAITNLHIALGATATLAALAWPFVSIRRPQHPV